MGAATDRRHAFASAYLQLGLSYSQLAVDGDASMLDVAIEELEKTVELEPYLGLHFANLGMLYLERGDLKMALTKAPGAEMYQLLLDELQAGGEITKLDPDLGEMSLDRFRTYIPNLFRIPGMDAVLVRAITW